MSTLHLSLEALVIPHTLLEAVFPLKLSFVNCTSDKCISVCSASIVKHIICTQLDKNNKEDNMNDTTLSGVLINNGNMLMNYHDYQNVLDNVTLKLHGISQEIQEWVRL